MAHLGKDSDRKLSGGGPPDGSDTESDGPHSSGVHFERVTAAEDAQQAILSTAEQPVVAKDVSVERRGGQYLGQMADASIQQLSSDRRTLLLGADEIQNTAKAVDKFGRCGPGYRLDSS
jgi:hypothetical protein